MVKHRNIGTIGRFLQLHRAIAMMKIIVAKRRSWLVSIVHNCIYTTVYLNPCCIAIEARQNHGLDVKDKRHQSDCIAIILPLNRFYKLAWVIPVVKWRLIFLGLGFWFQNLVTDLLILMFY